MRSMFGGRGAFFDSASEMKSSTSAIRSAALNRRSWPIVDEGSELIEAPQSDPATWPG